MTKDEKRKILERRLIRRYDLNILFEKYFICFCGLCATFFAGHYAVFILNEAHGNHVYKIVIAIIYFITAIIIFGHTLFFAFFVPANKIPKEKVCNISEVLFRMVILAFVLYISTFFVYF
jgi:hypothetical protein